MDINGKYVKEGLGAGSANGGSAPTLRRKLRCECVGACFLLASPYFNESI